MGLKFNAGVLGVVGVIGGGAMYSQSSDLTSNYQPTEAVITATTVDCFIKDSDGEIENKSTGTRAYMDCASAPLIAVRFDYDADDIKQRVKAVYRYRSHIDGNEYEGEFTREGYQKAEKLPVGKRVPVFASNTQPGESRTSSGNPFIDDNLEI